MLDIVDGTLLWQVGSAAAPAPPTPTPSTGDAAAIPSELYTFTGPRTRRQYGIGDPWGEILAWLRRLRRIDEDFQVSQTALQMAREATIDDEDVMEITRLTRRRD